MPMTSSFLRGPAAVQQLCALAACRPLLAVAIDPAARRGACPQVVAVGDAQTQLLIDAPSTPGLGEALAALPRLGAYDAKAVVHALQRSWPGRAAARWGCIKLCEQLLLQGAAAPLQLEAIAGRYGCPPPADIDQGLAAMQAHVAALSALLGRQQQALQQAGMQRVSRLEAAAVLAVARMEAHGMPLQRGAWSAVARRNAQALQQTQQRLGQHIGQQARGPKRAFDLTQDSELRAALQACGLPARSVRRAALAELPDPWGKLLVQLRTQSKLQAAYGESFLAHLGDDGRVHPTFEQIGASTGRMACRSPNLQAMVKDTPHRSCFRPAPGRVFVVADYNACELRILADMSADPVFVDAFARGEDVHARVASLLFERPVSRSERPDLRAVAKVVSFGLAYGMGQAALARTLRCSPAHAADLLLRYHRAFP
ncbi:MAG: hypothetical protein EOO40_03220, partial [Deltaproteobacteria bacterium]